MGHMIEMMVYGFVPVGVVPRVVQVISIVRMPSLLLSHPDRCKIAIDAVTNALRTRFGCVNEASKNLEAIGPEVKVQTLYPCREIGRRSFQQLAFRMWMAQLSSPPSEEVTEEERTRRMEDFREARHHVEVCRPCGASMRLDEMKLGERDKLGILSFEETITL